ncbi:hypothetical protein, partial [Paenibacillus cisolokensis]|uniref:hypothetical protein n=1 Tax=Paenibacillus cisolokensis TaxID=1658519 RepID=UPI001BCEC232
HCSLSIFRMTAAVEVERANKAPEFAIRHPVVMARANKALDAILLSLFYPNIYNMLYFNGKALPRSFQYREPESPKEWGNQLAKKQSCTKRSFRILWNESAAAS